MLPIYRLICNSGRACSALFIFFYYIHLTVGFVADCTFPRCGIWYVDVRNA